LRGRSGNPFLGDHRHTHTDFPNNRIVCVAGGDNVRSFGERIGSVRVVVHDLLRRLVLGGEKMNFGLGFGNRTDVVVVTLFFGSRNNTRDFLSLLFCIF